MHSQSEPPALSIAASSDSVQSIRRSTAIFFSGTMLSRLSGMFREMALAFCFGTNEALAALFVAFRFANLARRLFGEGALQSAFVPLFEQVRKESMEHGCRFFRDLSALWLCLLSLISILGMAGLLMWLQLLPPAHGTAEILQLMAIMVPSIIPTCLFGLNISFLQCQGQYFVASVAPIFFNLVIIISAFALCQYNPQNSMPLLSVAIVLGCAAQWLVSYLPVLRKCKEVLHDQLYTHIRLFSPDIKKLWHPLTLGLLGIGASQINNAIDAIFARAADPEGPALLWFASRLQQLPLALFGIALSSALLPPLARAIKRGEKEKYQGFVEHGLREVIALLFPCTGVLLVLGMAMINCIYGHGAFHSSSIIATTSCLQGYALALVPMGLIIIIAPAFYAKDNYTIPMKGACLSLLSNAVLNTILVFVFGWGAMSISIATSISSWMNAIYLFVKLRAEFGPLISREGIHSCWRSICASVAASLLVFAIIALWTFPPVFFRAWLSAGTYIPHTLLEQVLHLVAPFGLFVASLVFFAWVFKARDMLFWRTSQPLT